MKQIKTVIRPLSSATQFDIAVNRLLSEGWVLTCRKVISTPGDISEAFNYTVMQVLYAEFEKESAEMFEEITV